MKNTEDHASLGKKALWLGAGKRGEPHFLPAAIWSGVFLAELGKGGKGVVLVQIPQIFAFPTEFSVDFLEKMFLHFLFAPRTISRGFKWLFLTNTFHQFHCRSVELLMLLC